MTFASRYAAALGRAIRSGEAVLSSPAPSTSSSSPAFWVSVPGKVGLFLVCGSEALHMDRLFGDAGVAKCVAERLGLRLGPKDLPFPSVRVASTAGLTGKGGSDSIDFTAAGLGSPLAKSRLLESAAGLGFPLAKSRLFESPASGLGFPLSKPRRLESTAGGLVFRRLEPTAATFRSVGLHPGRRPFCTGDGGNGGNSDEKTDKKTVNCGNGERSLFPEEPSEAELAMLKLIMNARREGNDLYFKAMSDIAETRAELNKVKSIKRAEISAAKPNVVPGSFKLALSVVILSAVSYLHGSDIIDWIGLFAPCDALPGPLPGGAPPPVTDVPLASGALPPAGDAPPTSGVKA